MRDRASSFSPLAPLARASSVPFKTARRGAARVIHGSEAVQSGVWHRQRACKPVERERLEVLYRDILRWRIRVHAEPRNLILLGCGDSRRPALGLLVTDDSLHSPREAPTSSLRIPEMFDRDARKCSSLMVGTNCQRLRTHSCFELGLTTLVKFSRAAIQACLHGPDGAGRHWGSDGALQYLAKSRRSLLSCLTLSDKKIAEFEPREKPLPVQPAASHAANMSQADAEAAAAAILDAFREPGFASVCVKKAVEEAPDAKALFIELPLAAASMTAKLMAQTADRPPDQRFKPFVTRIRALKADDVAKVSEFTSFCQAHSGD